MIQQKTEQAPIAVLFDFDGVVVDTEHQYSQFWHRIGMDYLGMDDLHVRIKGQTLTYIYHTFFRGMQSVQAEITDKLNRFEQRCRLSLFPERLIFWQTSKRMVCIPQL